MIVWLASYPKSGNTWIRAFINAIFYSEDGAVNLSQLNNIPQYPARSLFKNSDIDYLPSILKSKFFNDTIEDVTIFVGEKDINGNLKHIFLKDNKNYNNDRGPNTSQIIPYIKRPVLTFGTKRSAEVKGSNIRYSKKSARERERD